MKSTGVMIPTLLGRLSKKPVTVLYPYEKLEVPEAFRGKIKFILENCISCGMCAKDCVSAACVMKEIDGKKRPVFDMDRCVFCGQCAESCPKEAIVMTHEYELAHFKRGEVIII